MIERTVITYPLPFDNWEDFRLPVLQFADSFRRNPPGCNYVLIVSCCWGEPTDEVRALFYGIKTIFVSYNADGCDIGSAQAVARALDNNPLMINLTTRCYFVRPDWGKCYVDAYARHGEALYGFAASKESGEPHICTRGYALKAENFREYEYEVTSRQESSEFEHGQKSISRQFRKRALRLWQVTWFGEQEEDGWFNQPETFRKGEQSACLMRDRHTDYFDSANAEEKLRLQRKLAGELLP